MGTNYYLQEIVDCDQHHEHVRSTHIGKSSAGWRFIFHATEDHQNFDDWDEVLKGGNDNYHLIHDEYGKIVDWSALCTQIEVKQGDKYELNGTDYLDGNGYWFSHGKFC